MHDDLFDDAIVRGAFERVLGFRARRLLGADVDGGWYFERASFGLRTVEACPLGFYAPMASGATQLDGWYRLLESGRAAALSSTRINLNPLDPRAPELEARARALGYGVTRHETHLLPIGSSIDAVREGYHATKRAQATRVPKVPSTILVADAARLDDYFAVYGASLKRWGRSSAIHPRALFEQLAASPSVRIWMNYVEGRLSCAMVVLYCRAYALYWQGVADIGPDQKQAYPMVRLMDAVVQHLIQEGIPCLNLGASEGLPNVRRFKEEFGARPCSYPALAFRSPGRSVLAGVGRALRRWSVDPGRRNAAATMSSTKRSTIDG